MVQKASHMYSELHMQLSDVLQYLEEENGIKVNRELFRKQFKYITNRENPKEKECFNLCVNLTFLSQKNPLNKTFFTVNSDTTMHYAAWVLAEGLANNEIFGIVPGMSMDCKSNDNRFAFSLFTINGRANSGKDTTYFMAIIPTETEDKFI